MVPVLLGFPVKQMHIVYVCDVIIMDRVVLFNDLIYQAL